MEDEGLRCEIDGERVSAYQAWVSVARHTISEGEFKRLSALRQWADDHAPDDPYCGAGSADRPQQSCADFLREGDSNAQPTTYQHTATELRIPGDLETAKLLPS